MKKIFFIATLALVILSSNLFAREPKFNVKKEGGQVAYDDATGKLYVGYNKVSQNLHEGVYNVRCKDGGSERCTAVVGGTTYYFTISDINNPDINNDFDAAMITNISNTLLGEVEQLNIESKLSGNLSKNYSLTDLKGKQHNVNFSIDYQLKDVGNGEINVFINTFNL